MSSQQTKSSMLSAFLVSLLLVLCACSLMPQPGQHALAPIEQRINAPYQPFRIIQVCLDGPPIFSARYFHEAATAIADRIDTAVTVNQGGLSVFVTFITRDSFQNDPLSFSVPAFPADPAAPSKPVSGDNPYENATAQQAYTKAFAAWQNDLITQHKKVAAARVQVKHVTDTLRSFTAPFDPVADDIYGCLQDASQHFQGTGEKYLLIASPMSNNTTLQASNQITLAGASVRVMWRTCQVASICQQNDATWKNRFLGYGARDVRFYDPAQEEASPVTF